MSERILVTEEYQLPPNPMADDVAHAVRSILNRPYVQKIEIEAGKPINVSWYKLPGEELFEPDTTVSDLLNKISLTDRDSLFTARGDSYGDLVRSVLQLQRGGLYARFAVVSPSSTLRNWLGIDSVYPLHNKLMGMEIVVDNEAADDTIILLATKERSGRLVDVEAGVKLTMVGVPLGRAASSR